jgi:hypothetical protein
MSYSIYSLCNLGLTESELLDIAEKAKAELSNGKSITSLSYPGISQTFQVEGSALEIFRAARFALNQLNPTKYASAAAVVSKTLGIAR